MQTSHEIIDGLLRNKPVERMGTYELVWEDALKDWVKQGFPANEKGEPADPCLHFGLDMYPVTDWFDVLPLRGYSEVVEETDQWVAKRNGAGAVLKYWKEKSGTPEHVDFRMTTRKIWEEDYRPHLLELDTERINIELVKEKMAICKKHQLHGYQGHLFVFENLRQSVGDLCLYETVLTDPDWFHDYNRVYTDFFKMHYKYIFDNAGVPDCVWMYEDMGYKNATFCSPKTYEELFFPYFREMIEFFHSYDLPVVLHTCGFIEKLIPQIVELGFAGMNPMEAKAGCDIRRIADQYADKLVFVGGLDARILETGDRDLITKEVKKLVQDMKDRNARFIFASDHSVSTNVKYEDYKLALDVFRDHCHY